MKKITFTLMAFLIALMSYGFTPKTNLSALSSSKDNDFDKFGIGFGIGFGFFYPEDVNNYLSSKYSSSSYEMDFGTTDIYMNECLSFVTTIRPVKYFRVNIVAEASIGPKVVTIKNSTTEFYNFGRYSGGAEAYFNLPFGSGRHSFMFGVGGYFHHMYFEDFRGNTFGLRVIPFGMSFSFGKFQPQILLGGDLLSKTTDSAYDGEFFHGMELNYNSGFIHINLLF